MKKLRAILIVVILGILLMAMTMVSVSAWTQKPDATPEDFLTEYPDGVYKYKMCYNDYWKYDNINCVRKWGDLPTSLSETTAKNKGAAVLHKLTTYVEINGNNAKFYAGDGHSSLPEGTLIHESNCEENNIMAALLYEGWRLDERL